MFSFDSPDRVEVRLALLGSSESISKHFQGWNNIPLFMSEMLCNLLRLRRGS
jgi:hypothetical protein